MTFWNILSMIYTKIKAPIFRNPDFLSLHSTTFRSAFGLASISLRCWLRFESNDERLQVGSLSKDSTQWDEHSQIRSLSDFHLSSNKRKQPAIRFFQITIKW
jgi:hypothetical protein